MAMEEAVMPISAAGMRGGHHDPISNNNNINNNNNNNNNNSGGSSTATAPAVTASRVWTLLLPLMHRVSSSGSIGVAVAATAAVAAFL
jgi:hypothetical protein